MSAAERMNVVIFSGGRGTASIVKALIGHPRIAVTLLVNAYDDGLSTGRLRQFVPGMLGPSDIRKCLVNLIGDADRSDRALRQLLEYRFPEGASRESVRALLAGMAALDAAGIGFGLAAAYADLSLEDAARAGGFCRHFLEYEQQHGPFEFGDCSLGNLWFTGAYLGNGRDFNRAIAEFHRFVRGPDRVMNVTDGRNLVLVGLKADGSLLATEAAIVSPQERSSVTDIFLVPAGTTPAKCREHAVFPPINPAAREALATADVIVYGPGTQHSSLFPSYLTVGVAEAIAGNATAEKVFVANIRKDHEIQSETANTLVEKLLYYLHRQRQQSFGWEQLVTRFFLQTTHGDQYLPFRQADFAYPSERVVLLDWETHGGAHLGGRVADELIRLINQQAQAKLQPPRYMVSLLVPALNEAPTVKRVLHELALLDFAALGLGKEIILVDGGSTDDTVTRARTETDAKVHQLPPPCGRGRALRHGIERAAGDVIVMFPSDGEYEVADVVPMVLAIVKNEFPVVFGSRNIRLANLSERIKQMRRGSRLGYLVSKYGGLLVGMLSLGLYNRYVSDVFCTVKAFDARLLRSLGLESEGVDLETEIIAKLWRRGTFILEVPVSFRPRPDPATKKTTVADGVRAVYAMFHYRYLKHE